MANLSFSLVTWNEIFHLILFGFEHIFGIPYTHCLTWHTMHPWSVHPCRPIDNIVINLRECKHVKNDIASLFSISLKITSSVNFIHSFDIFICVAASGCHLFAPSLIFNSHTYTLHTHTYKTWFVVSQILLYCLDTACKTMRHRRVMASASS